MLPTSHTRYCIVCGREFEPTNPDDTACPNCLKLQSAVARPPAPARRASAPAAPAPRVSAPAAPAPRTPTHRRSSPALLKGQRLFQNVPPLVDFAFKDEAVCYTLCTALGGQASSLAYWSRTGFDSSALLKIPEPLSVVMLSDGRPAVVGRRGAVVAIDYTPRANQPTFPKAQGHDTHWGISCAALKPKSMFLACGVPAEAAIFGLTVPSFQEQTLVARLTTRPAALAFSGDGRQLAIGFNDGALQIVDASTCRAVWQGRPSAFDGEGVVAVTPGTRGGWMVAYESNHVAHWNPDGEMLSHCRPEGALSALAVDPASGRVAVGDQHGSVYLWSPDLEEQLAVGPVHSAAIVRLVFQQRGSLLISAGESGEVKESRLS